MTKEEKKEQKHIEREKRKAKFDELNHQKALKYKKLQDTKIKEKNDFKKKSQDLKIEYKNNCHKIKLDIANELKTKIVELKNKNKKNLEFKKELSKFKKEYKDNLKKKLIDLKTAYKDNLFSIKVHMLQEIAKNQVTEKEQKKKKMEVDKKCACHIYHKRMILIDNMYNQKVDEILKEHQDKINQCNKKINEFTSKNKENKKSINYKQKLDELNAEYVKINLDRESKLIKNKIIYKNTCAQALHERDLSYDNELDTNFKIRRWWYGIGKEFQRITWPSAKKTFKDFWIVILVSLVLASIFALLDFILTLF